MLILLCLAGQHGVAVSGAGGHWQGAASPPGPSAGLVAYRPICTIKLVEGPGSSAAMTDVRCAGHPPAWQRP